MSNLRTYFRRPYFKGALFLYKGWMSIQNFERGSRNIVSSVGEPFSSTKAGCPSRFSKCGLQHLVPECHQKLHPGCTFRMCPPESAPRMCPPGRRSFYVSIKSLTTTLTFTFPSTFTFHFHLRFHFHHFHFHHFHFHRFHFHFHHFHFHHFHFYFYF